MFATAVRLSKASRRPLTPKRGNKDYYKGTRQAYLPGGHRTGAPGKHVVRGKAKYRLVDEQVRVFVAPPVDAIRNSPLKAYVDANIDERAIFADATLTAQGSAINATKYYSGSKNGFKLWGPQPAADADFWDAQAAAADDGVRVLEEEPAPGAPPPASAPIPQPRAGSGVRVHKNEHGEIVIEARPKESAKEKEER